MESPCSAMLNVWCNPGAREAPVSLSLFRRALRALGGRSEPPSACEVERQTRTHHERHCEHDRHYRHSSSSCLWSNHTTHTAADHLGKTIGGLM
jgi:hypothetical protein